jgi:pyruvate formate lyase activating enzyme
MSTFLKEKMTRKEFIKKCCGGLAFLGLSSVPFLPFLSKQANSQGQYGLIKKKLSPYYQPLDKGAIRCTLCPKECYVPKGRRGYCEVRENQGGQYYSLVYGNPCAVHVDPIEKKPLYHVLPGTFAFSIATVGCNFDCKYCQNWQISQANPEDTYNYDLPPAQVVKLAEKLSCQSIAYTYVEPSIFFEYMYDTSILAKEKGILNVYHSNGYINQKPLRDLCPYMDAANIDLKGFTEKFYDELLEGELKPVLDSLVILRSEGVHLEITNLVVPTKNDDMKVIKEMCHWIRDELGSDVPLHFSRFSPMYKLKNLPPTPVETLEEARRIAMDLGLEYVYIGNVPGNPAENTYCPQCKRLVIERTGYTLSQVNMEDGKCKFCAHPIPGIWK